MLLTEELKEKAEDMVHMLTTWSEAYPTDIFPEITKEDIEYINAINPHLSGRFFAHAGRHFASKALKPAIAMIKELTGEQDDTSNR